jgi:Spy/CpxP family protein refolding chaperone
VSNHQNSKFLSSNKIKGSDMKKIIISSAVVAAVIMLFTAVIYSQPAGNNNKQGRGPNSAFRDGKSFEMLCNKLNLTDSQKDKIYSLRNEHQKKMIDLRADLQKARLEARGLRRSNNISRSDVVNSTEKINKIKNEMALLRTNHRMDIYEVLTPEQRQIAKDMRDDFQANRQWHKNGMKRTPRCY